MSDLTSCFAPAPIKFRGREDLPWRPNTFSQSAKQNTWRHNFRRETLEYSCLIFVIESICSITALPVVSTVHTSWLPLIASGDQQLPSINYVAIPDWPGYVTIHATVPDWLRLHFNVRKSIREARGQSWSVMRGQNVRSCDQDGLQARPIVTWADISMFPHQPIIKGEWNYVSFTFTFSRHFYHKRLTMSTFVRRKRNNNISLSVQWGCS